MQSSDEGYTYEDSMNISSAHHTRHVLDVAADDEANITAVRSATELQAAIMFGAQDIVIQEHVDISDLNLAFNANSSRSRTVLGEVKLSTRSIRVLSLACVCMHVVLQLAEVHYHVPTTAYLWSRTASCCCRLLPLSADLLTLLLPGC